MIFHTLVRFPISIIPRRRNSTHVKVNWPGVALFGLQRIPCEIVDVSPRRGQIVRASNGPWGNLRMRLVRFVSRTGLSAERESMRHRDPQILQRCRRERLRE